MVVTQIAAAVAAANTYADINAVSAVLWKAHAAGQIDDTAAQSAAEALQARKLAIGSRTTKNAPRAFSGRSGRHVPRSPDRAASLRRRRACAASGAVPSKIAADFTHGELAVMSIVAAEIRRSGSSCSWPLDRIAACAGVCRRTAQIAIRRAAMLGLIRIEERPRAGRRSDTNVVTIISPEWLAWLKLGRHRVKNGASHEYSYTCTLSRYSSDPILSGSNSGSRSWTPPTSPRSRSKTPPKG